MMPCKHRIKASILGSLFLTGRIFGFIPALMTPPLRFFNSLGLVVKWYEFG
jgi:hypothetical protein